MERPAKRPRLGSRVHGYDEDTDELDFEPQQLNAFRDPGYQLQKSRAYAAFKLKSTFEDIFVKYGKDLTGISDEIDLATGKVVVDNGHLESLRDADLEDKASNAGDQSDTASLAEEERILQGRSKEPRAPTTSAPMSQPGASLSVFNDNWPAQSSLLHRPPHMPNMTARFGMEFPGPGATFSSLGFMSESVDPQWRTPELPAAAFANLTRQSFGVCSQVKKRALGGLLAGHGEDDHEDDILLESSVSSAKQQESQLVVRRSSSQVRRLPSEARHPAVGSSSSASIDASKVSHAPLPLSKANRPSADSASKSKTARKQPPKSSSLASSITSAGRTLRNSGVRKTRYRLRNVPCDSSTVVLRTLKSDLGSEIRRGKRREDDSETIRKPDEPSQPSSLSKEPSKTRSQRWLRSSGVGPDTRMPEIPSKEQQLDGAPSGKTQPSGRKAASQQSQVRSRQPLAVRMILRKSRRIQGRPTAVIAPTISDPAKAVRARIGSRLIRNDDDNSSNAAEITTSSEAITGASESNTKSADAVQVENADKQPAPETFTRHIQDPSYEFSDEDVPVQNKKPGGNRCMVRKESNQPGVPTRKRTRASLAAVSDEDIRGEEDAGLTLPQEASETSSCTQALTEVESLAETKRVTRSSGKKCPGDSRAVEGKKFPSGEDARGGKTTPPEEETSVEKRISGESSAKKASAETTLAKKASEKKKSEGEKGTREDKPLAGEKRIPREKTSEQDQITTEKVISGEKDAPCEKTSEPQVLVEKTDQTRTAHQRDDPYRCNDTGKSIPAAQMRSPQQESRQDQNVGPTHGKSRRPALSHPDKNKQMPATPQNPTRRIVKGNKVKTAPTSSAKRSIVSLVSDDDDEDELSLGPEAFTCLGSRGAIPSPLGNHVAARPRSGSGTARRTSTMRRSLVLAGTPGVRIRGAFDVACRPRSAPHGKAKTDSDVGSELIRTPGGSVRRCGEDGFRCERDFCFVCL